MEVRRLKAGRLRNTLGSLGAIVLAGCAVPEPPAPEESLSQALPETTQVRETYAEAPGTVNRPLPANWIADFGDVQLEAIVEEALANNLNLRAAASQLEAAGTLVTQASSQMAPVVAVAGDAAQQGVEGGSQSSSRMGALNISWELDIWGRIRAETRAAEAQFAAATADFEFARLSLKAQVAKSWFTAVEIQQQRAFAQEVVELKQRTLQIVETKFEFGEVGSTEVHLARADLAAARERMQQVEGAHRVALRALEVLLGRYPSAELEVVAEFVAVPPSIPPGLPSELLQRRPDLVAAEQQVAAAFNLSFAADAARLPSIGLTASAGATDNPLSQLLGAGTGFWNVGANFLGPVFAGGALRAQAEQADAQQQAALARYGQQALVAFSEVETALSNEGLLANREMLLGEVCQDNQAALELAQAQFESGAIELLDILEMQSRLIQSRAALISIRNARLAERVNLHLAIGGDFEQPSPETENDLFQPS